MVPSITCSEEGHVNLEAHLGAEAKRWYQCLLVMEPLKVDALTSVKPSTSILPSPKTPNQNHQADTTLNAELLSTATADTKS